MSELEPDVDQRAASVGAESEATEKNPSAVSAEVAAAAAAALAQPIQTEFGVDTDPMSPPFRLIKQLINETGDKYSVCKAALTANGNNLEAAAVSIAAANQAAEAEGAESEAIEQIPSAVSAEVAVAAAEASKQMFEQLSRGVEEERAVSSESSSDPACSWLDVSFSSDTTN